MKEIETTRVFVKVVQQGSFSKAARLLRLPVSTVSRAVSRLEAEVGTQLLRRTTRALTLTAGGKAFYETCLGPIQILEDARRSLEGSDSIVAGPIKVTAPEDLGTHAVTPAIAELMRLHPQLSFEFNYTDEVVDLIGEGYDLAVRIGPLSNSRFKATRVGKVIIVAVASPAYLASRPRVRNPKDLLSHDLLSFNSEVAGTRLNFTSRTGTMVLQYQPRTFGNQMISMVEMAELGAGIALVPHYACLRRIEEGKLVRVLPEWSSTEYTVSLVMAHSSGGPARVRLVADKLREALVRVLNS